MTIKQYGGVFGRNPTFNNVTVDGTLTVDQIVEKTGAAGITLDGVTLKDGNVVLANGKGIDFSATSGTGTSELFDDYEEGTFTPVLEYDGGNGTMSVSYSAQSGQYVKIGKMVWIKCFIRLSAFSKGTASGGPCIGGLPFSMSGLDIGVAPIATYGAPFSSQVIGQPAGTQVRLMRLVNNAAYVALDDPDGNSQYYTMFCYVEN